MVNINTMWLNNEYQRRYLADFPPGVPYFKEKMHLGSRTFTSFLEVTFAAGRPNKIAHLSFVATIRKALFFLPRLGIEIQEAIL